MLTVDIMVFYLVLRGLDTVEDDMTAFDDIQVCQQAAPKAVSHFSFPRAASVIAARAAIVGVTISRCAVVPPAI